MRQVLPTNYTGKGKWKVVANHMNRVGRLFNMMIGFGGIDIDVVGDEIRFSMSRRGLSGGLDLSRFAFGWLGSQGQTALVRAGYIEGRFGYRAIAGATVQIGGNSSAPHLIIVSGDDQGGAIELNSVLESSFSGDSADRWRRVLYRVYLNNGVPVMDMVGKGVGGVVL